MHSAEGENVPLVESVACEGNIEDWLQKLCEEMQRTVRYISREAVSELISVRGNPQLVTRFIFGYPSQVVVTATQIQWTSEVTNALHGTKPADRKEMSRSLVAMKELFADLIRSTGILPSQMRHLETLTTMAVHNQEVWEGGVRRAKDAAAFEWQRCLRFYWTERDRCNLSIVDADIAYCDEYLGIKERLVITPPYGSLLRHAVAGAHHAHGRCTRRPSRDGKNGNREGPCACCGQVCCRIQLLRPVGLSVPRQDIQGACPVRRVGLLRRVQPYRAPSVVCRFSTNTHAFYGPQAASK